MSEEFEEIYLDEEEYKALMSGQEASEESFEGFEVETIEGFEAETFEGFEAETVDDFLQETGSSEAEINEEIGEEVEIFLDENGDIIVIGEAVEEATEEAAEEVVEEATEVVAEEADEEEDDITGILPISEILYGAANMDDYEDPNEQPVQEEPEMEEPVAQPVQEEPEMEEPVVQSTQEEIDEEEIEVFLEDIYELDTSDLDVTVMYKASDVEKAVDIEEEVDAEKVVEPRAPQPVEKPRKKIWMTDDDDDDDEDDGPLWRKNRKTSKEATDSRARGEKKTDRAVALMTQAKKNVTEEPTAKSQSKKKSQVEAELVERSKNKYSEAASLKRRKNDDDEEFDEAEEGFSFEAFADKMVYLVGALVVLFAIIVGVVLLTGKTRKEVIGPDMEDIGRNVQDIELIGEKGIENVFAIEKERLDELSKAAEKITYDEIDMETGLVTVDYTLTSILRDLKIKFINKNGKLVANVPFSVSLTDKSGSSTNYVDENKDGIIYLENLNGGKYTVCMNGIDGYDTLYKFSEETQTINVKSQIEYEKVDVKNEIKTEAQVDVAKEDTKVTQTQIESKLTDTVGYVVTAKVLASSDETGYAEIDKATKIKDPIETIEFKDLAKIKTFRTLDTDNGTPGGDGGQSGSGTQGGDGGQGGSGSQDGGNSTTPDNTGDAILPETPANPDGTGTPTTPDGTETPANPDGTGTPATPDVYAVKLNYSQKTIFLNDENKFSLVATVTKNDTVDDTAELVWTCDNTDVLTVENGTITALKEGGAMVTCTVKDQEIEAAKCIVYVNIHPKENKVSKLTDVDGNQVYVYDTAGKKYREATYSDYYTAAKFYKSAPVEYKYTGWWTIDGKTYYYDGNGKKVTGEQVILGARYEFDSDGVLRGGTGTFGIDVSKWNGSIDWNTVAKSGVSYAIIRCGFRGSTEGGLIEDSKFESNIKGATSAGIKVGVYFFTQAVNEAEAIEEASMVLDMINGYKVSYPIFLDVESAGAGCRADGISKETRTAVIKAFCQTIANSGYTAGVYANRNWLESKINTSELSQYKIWLAQYNATPTYGGRYDVWQYSSTGSINGIGGAVDLNLSYMGY